MPLPLKNHRAGQEAEVLARLGRFIAASSPIGPCGSSSAQGAGPRFRYVGTTHQRPAPRAFAEGVLERGREGRLGGPRAARSIPGYRGQTTKTDDEPPELSSDFTFSARVSLLAEPHH